MRYLLDTCVISELIRKKPLDRLVNWMEECDEESLFLSVLTFGEIQKGICKLSDMQRRATIQRWLDRDLRDRFSGRIIAVDTEIASIWGQIQGEAEVKGEPLPVIDALIGATAIASGLTVVTRNERDIGRTGARVLNPWEGQA